MLRQILLIFFGFTLISQFSSCSYFKINRSQADLVESIENVGKLYKRFILHAEERTFEIKDIQIESNHISGMLVSNPSNVHFKEGRSYRYRVSEQDIKYEVHLYANSPIELQNGLLSLPIIDIYLISIIEPDREKNVASFVGSTLGAIGLLAVVAAATKSSCPYVYVHDGEGFVFQGETFGGAIGSNLARHDYMPLPAIKPANGSYNVRLTNELKEHQFTDIAELVVINHESDQKVLLDKYGKAQLLENLQPPVSAKNQMDIDILPTLKKDDKISFQFDELQSSEHAALLTFEKPEGAKRANLVIRAQNTMWFDYLYGEAISKFGSYYDTWSEEQSQLTREEHLQEVLDGGFPLFIYVKKNNNWELVDYLLTPGPLASREFVIPMDISEIQNNNLEVKLETGFMFWEIDYAKIDFTPKSNIKPKKVTATSAIGSHALDWTAALSKKDYDYMIQKSIGEITEMEFDAPEINDGQTQSVFLHTYGYYKLIREFEGMPRWLEIQKFQKMGYFSEYSKTEYLNLVKVTEELANKNHRKSDLVLSN